MNPVPEMQSVVLRETSDGIGYLTLNRAEKRNALNDVLIAELTAALRTADADAEVRVIALRAAGEDFCAGADLGTLRRIAEGDVLENLADVDRLAELFALPRRLRKPVVALVQGRALAGGCGLATACDLVLASGGAQFGYPETRIGFVPAMVTALLRRNLGEKRCFELLVRGHTLSAAEAERLGLINHVFAEDGFMGAAAAYLADLAGRSASALQLTKRLLYNTEAMSFEAALRSGADLNVVARMTPDLRAGVDHFLQR